MKVSVIIPVYKAERLLPRAVASALEQPEAAEIILIDDGSPDASADICRRLAREESRIKLLQHEGGANRGAGASRNLGLRNAACQYVAFLDADDYYLQGRFRTAREIMEHDPTMDGVYDAVGTDFEAEAQRRWWQERGRPMLTMLDAPVPPARLFEVLVRGGHGHFHTNGVTVRRRLFDRAGLFPEHLRMSQDLAMWIKMAAVGKLVAGSTRSPSAMRFLHSDNRIIRDEKAHGEMYWPMVWEYLARWAVEERLPWWQRRLTFAKLLATWPHDRDVGRGWLRQKGHECSALLALLRQYPSIARVSPFWRKAEAAVGLAPLVRRLGIRGKDTESAPPVSG